MSDTFTTSHGWVDGECSCGAREGSRPWAEGCPERRFFASGQEVTRDMPAWEIAPMRYLDGVLPASLTQPTDSPQG